ncbi:MAG: 1-acyl-sn-glycerol-3-phosphate acyltransferase [Sphingobacteriaceae bacterium]
MITPKKNLLITGFFNFYINRIIKRHFHRIHYNPVDVAPEKAILLLANHFSWWDGFLLYHLNKLYFHRRFHIMILDETAKTQWFMKYLGAFSIKKSSRAMIQSLDYAGGLLRDPENLVLIFPQGKLYSNFTDHINFENGLRVILKQAGTAFQTIFSASFIEHLDQRQPTVCFYLKIYHTIDKINVQEMDTAYQAHFNSAKSGQTAIVL